MSYVTLADAVQLVKDLKFFYGKSFTDQWVGTSDTDLAVRFAALLADVHRVQFEHGLKKMETSIYLPNMPQFKNWCLEKKAPGQNWLTVSEAWALCLSYDNKEAVQVSKQAMSAFKKVRHILNVEGQKPAYNAFKGFYERIVSRDKEMGKPQEPYIEPPRLQAPSDNNRQGMPITDEQRQAMQKNLDLLYEKLHFKPKTARNLK